MYRNHAAREDTIIFPVWKQTMNGKQLDEMNHRFEDIEHEQFGEDGFENAVKQIAAIEGSLGLADISQFSAPGETFSGVVARISHTLDQKTRTMPVEVDVINDSARLAPGMFPEVVWPAKRLQPSLLVPPSAIAVTTERTFIVRIRNGVVEWIDVRRGVSMGDLVEVFGDLAENDVVATRGTDELRAGTNVNVKESAPSR